MAQNLGVGNSQAVGMVLELPEDPNPLEWKVFPGRENTFGVTTKGNRVLIGDGPGHGGEKNPKPHRRPQAPGLSREKTLRAAYKGRMVQLYNHEEGTEGKIRGRGGRGGGRGRGRGGGVRSDGE